MKGPNYLERKATLFAPETTVKEAIRWGERYVEARRFHDAAAFYRRAGHEEGLEQIRKRAVESGDYLLYREAAAGSSPPAESPDEVASLAHRAEELGRWNDACKAYDRLQDEPGMQRAKEALASLTGPLVSEASAEGPEGEDGDHPGEPVSGQPPS